MLQSSRLLAVYWRLLKINNLSRVQLPATSSFREVSLGSIPSAFQIYQVGCGFNSKRLQTLTKSLSLSDFKFEQVGHCFNSKIQKPSLIVKSKLIHFANRNSGINLAPLFKMSDRGGRNNGRGGRGRGGANRGGRSVGSQTWDRVKLGPRLVKKIADLTIFNQSKGKSGSYGHAARVEMQNHAKSKSLPHLIYLK
jgi:hypothetical protein